MRRETTQHEVRWPVRFDGTEVLSWRDRPYRTEDSPLLPTWILTPFNGLDGYHPIVGTIDDVYVDEGRARLVMTDAPNYQDSSAFAVQPIVSWSDTTISFARKRQGVAIGDIAYLHVFDAGGRLVHSGEALTVAADDLVGP